MKNLKGKFTCYLEIYYFYNDFFIMLGKRAKKMERVTGFEPATVTLAT